MQHNGTRHPLARVWEDLVVHLNLREQGTPELTTRSASWVPAVGQHPESEPRLTLGWSYAFLQPELDIRAAILIRVKREEKICFIYLV